MEKMPRDTFWRCLRTTETRTHVLARSGFALLSRGTHERLHIEPLLQGAIVKLKGDFTFMDPVKLFTLSGIKSKLHRLQQSGHWNFSVNYKDEKAYVLSTECWTDDTFFEISRQGRFVFRSESPSSFIGIIPRRLLHVLIPDEDVNLHEDDGVCVACGDGVSFGNVHGQLIHCENGFRIENESLQNCDIVCEAVDLASSKKIWRIDSSGSDGPSSSSL